MTAKPEAGAKTCVVCRRDCAGKPRVKDKKGRYFHRDCYTQAKLALAAKKVAQVKAKQAASHGSADRAASPEDEIVALPSAESDRSGTLADFEALDSSIGQALDDRRACPNCGADLKPGVLLCAACGYDKETGELGSKMLGFKDPDSEEFVE